MCNPFRRDLEQSIKISILLAGLCFPQLYAQTNLKFPRTIPWARDTWEWDVKSWKLMDTTGPLGRVASMAYDKKNKTIVMFGGVGEAVRQGEEQPLYNDTWGWNGKVWTKLADGGPAARSMLETIRKRIVDLMKSGKTLDEIIAADPTKEYKTDFDRAPFITLVYDSLKK